MADQIRKTTLLDINCATQLNEYVYVTTLETKKSRFIVRTFYFTQYDKALDFRPKRNVYVTIQKVGSGKVLRKMINATFKLDGSREVLEKCVSSLNFEKLIREYYAVFFPELKKSGAINRELRSARVVNE